MTAVHRCNAIRGEARSRVVCGLPTGHPGDHRDTRGRSPVTWPGCPSRPHPPLRPLWTCRVCDQDWPCEPARTALLDGYGGYGRRDLMSFLGVQLLLAEEDLRTTLGGERPSAYAMFRRFLSWARRPPVRAAGSHGAEGG